MDLSVLSKGTWSSLIFENFWNVWLFKKIKKEAPLEHDRYKALEREHTQKKLQRKRALAKKSGGE